MPPQSPDLNPIEKFVYAYFGYENKETENF